MIWTFGSYSLPHEVEKITIGLHGQHRKPIGANGAPLQLLNPHITHISAKLHLQNIPCKRPHYTCMEEKHGLRFPASPSFSESLKSSASPHASGFIEISYSFQPEYGEFTGQSLSPMT